jgi:hypothetical protein
MADVERREPRPDEPGAVARERQSVTYQVDRMTDLLREMASNYKKFEEFANKLGYVSPRILREMRRRKARRFRKELVDTLVTAGRLVINFRRSRGSEDPQTSSTSEGEGARENRD